MNFTDLKKHLESGTVLPAYLVLGEDDYLKNSAVNQLTSFVAPNNDFNQSFFSSENLDEKKLFDICNSGTFFGDKKIVVLKEYDGQKSQSLADNVKEYLKNPNPSTVLVLVVNAEKSNFANLQNIEKISCNRLERNLLTNWITVYSKKKGGVIPMDAAELLVDYTNGYLSKIELELNKLLAYRSGTPITSDDIVLMVNKDLEYTIFELTDALAAKNNEKAIQIGNDLLSDRKSASGILPLIYKYFRRLFYVSVTKMTDSEIAEMLGVKEYAVKMSRRQTGAFGPKALKEILELCGRLDEQLKNSQIAMENAIHILLFQILELHKK